MPNEATVLIVDDDLLHLKIYSWIIESAGYRALQAPVHLNGFEIPEDTADLVLLDYNLAGHSPVQVAELIRLRLPKAPIFVLSDSMDMPSDIAPLAQGFFRKGEPAKLVDQLHLLLPKT